MVKKYTLNEDAFKKFKNTSEKDIQYLKRELSTIVSKFNDFGIPVYLNNSNSFIWCYKGLENMKCFNDEHPKLEEIPIDLGFGVTFESIAKYLKDNYINNEEKYFITSDLIPIDYEKNWKLGSFINLDGENTEEYFYSINDIEKTDVKNHFIRFKVFHLVEK